MDIQAQTKIAVLIEKINYLNHSVQHGGGMTKIDKDLMLGYVKELYETLLSFNVEMPVQQQPPQNYQPTNQSFQQQNNGNEFLPPKKENFLRSPSINAAYEDSSNRKTVSQMISEKNGSKISVNEKLKRNARELADKLQLVPIKDLKTFIGLNKRFAFTSNLFNNNATDYEKAIEKINSAPNYEEAMAFVQSTLIPKYNWDLDDEHFVDLHTFIVRRFMN